MVGAVQNTEINGTPHVWLQGVGYHPAMLTSELKPGFTMVWNTGSTSTVVSIEVKGKTALIVERNTETGREWTRKRRLATLTACREARGVR